MTPEKLTRTAGGWDLTREIERLRSESVSSGEAVGSVEARTSQMHEAGLELTSLRARLENVSEMKGDVDEEEYQSMVADLTEQITRCEETEESLMKVATLLDHQLGAVRTEAATRINAFGRMVVAMARFRRKMQRKVAGTVSGSTYGGGRASMRSSPSNARQQSIVE